MGEMGHCFVMVGDFTGFFDNIDHKYLKQKMKALLGVEELSKDWYAIFKNVTKYGSCRIRDLMDFYGMDGNEVHGKKKLDRKYTIVDKDEFKKLQNRFHKNPHSYGIPQGSTISAVLANVYMMEYDRDMQSFVQEHQGMYMRYSDDTIVILPLDNDHTSEEYITRLREIVSRYDGKVELELNKTKQFEYCQGNIIPLTEEAPKFIDYLGLRLHEDGLRLRPRGITKYHYRLRKKAATIKRWHAQKIHKKQKNMFYEQIYRVYGSLSREDRKQGRRNFPGYVELVDRRIGLDNDPEAQRLLHGGADAKVAKAIHN